MNKLEQFFSTVSKLRAETFGVQAFYVLTDVWVCCDDEKRFSTTWRQDLPVAIRVNPQTLAVTYDRTERPANTCRAKCHFFPPAGSPS